MSARRVRVWLGGLALTVALAGLALAGRGVVLDGAASDLIVSCVACHDAWFTLLPSTAR
jgi:cytochrome c553